MRGVAWLRSNYRVIAANDVDTNGCREKRAKNPESVPAVSLLTGIDRERIQGR